MAIRRSCPTPLATAALLAAPILLAGCSTLAVVGRVVAWSVQALVVAGFALCGLGVIHAIVALWRGKPVVFMLVPAAAAAACALLSDLWFTSGLALAPGSVGRSDLFVLAASVVPVAWASLATAAAIAPRLPDRRNEVIGVGAAAPGLFAAALTLIAWLSVLPAGPVTEVALGELSCELLDTGRVACWYRGRNRLVPGLTGARDIAVIGWQACAVVEGRVVCWEAEGAPGSALATGAVQVVLGGGQVCARLATGAVACNGSPFDPYPDLHAPLVPMPGVTATSLAASRGLVCAARPDGPTLCWGTSVGPGWIRTETPIEVAGLEHGEAVAVTFCNACVLRDGVVTCWGQPGRPGSETEPASAVTGLPRATALVAGESYGCVLSDGAVWCWGEGGVLAQTTDPWGAPARVDLPGKATAVFGGPAGGCALLDGDPWCWGGDRAGELIGAVPRDCDLDKLDIVFDPCVDPPQRIRPGR